MLCTLSGSTGAVVHVSLSGNRRGCVLAHGLMTMEPQSVWSSISSEKLQLLPVSDYSSLLLLLEVTA